LHRFDAPQNPTRNLRTTKVKFRRSPAGAGLAIVGNGLGVESEEVTGGGGDGTPQL